MKDGMYMQSEVLALGFSKKLIDQLLPDPVLKQNPRYRSAAPMKLFLVEDVEKAMETDSFREHLEKSEKRKAAARKAVETKKKKLEIEVEEKIKDIEVDRIENVFEETLWAKMNYYMDRGDYDSDPHLASAAVQDRWAVNFIRHNLTYYDYDLYVLKGKPGIQNAYCKYKNAVLDEIAKVYPELKNECERQKKRIFEERIILPE